MGWWSRLFSRRDEDSQREPIKAGWLASDRRLYTKLAEFLDEPSPTPQIVSALGGVAMTGQRSDLGFGVTEVVASISGGTASARVSAIVFNERIARLQVLLSWSYGGRPEQVAALREVCGDRIAIHDEGGVRLGRLDRRYAESEAQLHAARAAILGAVAAPDVPAELESAFKAMNDLHVSVIEAGAVGVAGRPARQPMAEIVAARRVDLLRTILRGPNAVGRVNAACALLAGFADVLDDSDRAAIRVIKELPTPIMLQSGCTFIQKRASELIP